MITTNENKDIYEVTDDAGRKVALKYLLQHLKNKGCTDIKIKEAKEKYAHYDLLLTATTRSNQVITYCIECKDRNVSSTQYQADMIEINKYYNLLIRSEMNDEIPLYISTFNNNTATIHNINKAIKYKEKKNRPVTKVEDNGNENTNCYQLVKDNNTTTITLN